MNTKTKAFSSDVTVVDGERAVSAVISTTAVDRDHEVLVPQGCNWKDFQQNPVIFLNHNYADYFGNDTTREKLPVGKCTALTRDKDSISFKMTFAERPAGFPAEKEWVPDTLFSLYQQGVMRAFSVGFIPVESRAATDKDLLDYGADCRGVISKWKLLEVSCVPLPANQEAVALAVSKGILTRDGAKSMFGKSGEVSDEQVAAAAAPAPEPEAKADKEKPAMGACAACGKEFPLDDMEEQDEAMYCSACMPAKSADTVTAEEPVAEPAPAEDAPQKHVVREIEAAAEPEYEIKHVHRVILNDDVERAEKNVKIVHRQLAKMRGRVYAD